VVLARGALFLIATIGCTTAYGWGVQGHQVAGYVANAYLTKPTRNELRNLLGTDNLATISIWMDTQRNALAESIPDSPRWHYENRAVCGRNAASECPNDACITRQLERHLAILRNTEASRRDRIQALRVVAHLIGDLHQPLHLADHDDRGGNDLLARLPDERDARKLHAVWDTEFVKLALRRRSVRAYAQALMRQYDDDLAGWRLGDVDEWARETYKLGKERAYGALSNFSCRSYTRQQDPTQLTDEYVSESRDLVERQLVKAGLRLARTLNELLDPDAKP